MATLQPQPVTSLANVSKFFHRLLYSRMCIRSLRLNFPVWRTGFMSFLTLPPTQGIEHKLGPGILSLRLLRHHDCTIFRFSGFRMSSDLVSRRTSQSFAYLPIRLSGPQQCSTIHRGGPTSLSLRCGSPADAPRPESQVAPADTLILRADNSSGVGIRGGGPKRSI